MVFSSSIFLFVFLPITITIYYLLNDKFKNVWLLIASLFFYSWGEPKYILLIIASILINYVFGLIIEKLAREYNRKYRKFALVMIVTIDLVTLGIFKYLDFAIANINRFVNKDIPLRNIALPIGISFFSFQIMSYVIDVYRGEKAQRNILDLGLYIALFPQLIAGPIVRYSDIRDQLRNRSHSIDKFYKGVILFMIGFSKKILIADQLSPLVDKIFDGNGFSAYVAWVGAIAYTLQIYFDFSGYSDMARGLGNIFGFEFMENFNYPYVSSSIKEFWRRWHISLSTWFRDYLYIPMGGSRCSTSRQIINLLVVFFLTGLWHGASWNFIIWGLYYAAFLIAERLFLGKYLEKAPNAIEHAYALVVVVIGWIFFKAPGASSALHYIANLFRIDGSSWADLVSNLNRQYIFCLIVGVIFSIPFGKKIFESCIRDDIALYRRIISVFSVFVVFIIAISYMVGSGFSPFLYFRF